MIKQGKRTLLKLIVNPSAGNPADTKKNLGAIARCLEANGFKVNVARAKPKAAATPLAKQAAKDGYKVIVAMGGDGTVEAVMRGLTGSKARLGIIPTGVQNTIARSLGVPLDLEQACRLIASGSARRIDVAQVKRGRGKWIPFFEMVGVGYAAALGLGPADAGKPEDELFRSQIGASPEQRETTPRAILNLDGGRIMEVETRLLTASNTPVFGKKFFIPPPDHLQEGLLDISIFQGFGEVDLHGYYAKMKAGAYAGEGDIRHVQSSTLTLRAYPPMEVVADGVDLGRGTVSLRILPGALRVIAARSSRDLLGLPRGSYELSAAPAQAGNDGGAAD